MDGLAGGSAHNEGGSRESIFDQVRGQGGDPTLSVFHVVRDSDGPPHCDAWGRESTYLQPPYCLLGQPTGQHDETEHGPEKQKKQVVSGVDGSESDRERSHREDRPLAAVKWIRRQARMRLHMSRGTSSKATRRRSTLIFRVAVGGPWLPVRREPPRLRGCSPRCRSPLRGLRACQKWCRSAGSGGRGTVP